MVALWLGHSRGEQEGFPALELCSSCGAMTVSRSSTVSPSRYPLTALLAVSATLNTSSAARTGHRKD